MRPTRLHYPWLPPVVLPMMNRPETGEENAAVLFAVQRGRPFRLKSTI